jgi:hypothetical protein
MKGLEVNVRVQGLDKACRGLEGVIIEVTQMIGFKKYKVAWSNGQVLIHLSRSLAVWGLQAAEGAIIANPENVRAKPAVGTGREDIEANGGNVREDGDDGSDQESCYGSRYKSESAIS